MHPRLAVISCGAGNRFGHPHAEVAERLRAFGVKAVRLDREGGAIVTTDGVSMVLETWSGTRTEFPPAR